MSYSITHTPFTTGEAHEVRTGLELDEAKAALAARAERMLKRFPGCSVNWDQGDMGYELTDEEALMVGDYQGRTQIVREED